MSTLKVALVDIALHLRPVDVLICSASFESRSLSIPACVKDVPFKTVLICVNENFPHVLRKTGKRLQGMFPESGSMVLLNTDDPLRTADSLQLALRAELAKGNTRFLVDITTFTHESLLILLRIMKWLEILSIDIAYASAKEYSVGDAEERKWLSKGIGDIRSVLGYPGEAMPSRKLHLIVMAGFEAERAERLIQEYEPSVISLGLGDPNYSISPDHYRANQIFHRRLIEKYSNVLEFTFSCTDCYQARESLRGQVDAVSGHNVLISPMNTKISTVGAALLAMDDESIQLGYATAHKYNEKAYSSPGDECYYSLVTL